MKKRLLTFVVTGILIVAFGYRFIWLPLFKNKHGESSLVLSECQVCTPSSTKKEVDISCAAGLICKKGERTSVSFCTKQETSVSVCEGGSLDADESTLMISSPDFKEGERIPQNYTCDGIDQRPRLSITHIPDGAKSLIVIVLDPDAPSKVWSHWLVWNLPPKPIAISNSVLPEGAIQGKNDFGKNIYSGPCPPPGMSHRYQFQTFALDTTLTLAGDSTFGDLMNAINDHVIARTILTSTYRSRSKE